MEKSTIVADSTRFNLVIAEASYITENPWIKWESDLVFSVPSM